MMQHAIARRLGLSQDQMAKMKAVREKTHEAMQAIRADAALTPEQRQTKGRTTLQSARTEAREILTAEQKEKLDEMRDRMLFGGEPGPGRF